MTPEALRNWERNGLLTITRDQAGRRVYSKENLDRLKIILMLRNTGYGLMAILRMLSTLDSGEKENLRQVLDTPDATDDISHASDRWLTTLNEHEQRANAILDHLRNRMK